MIVSSELSGRIDTSNWINQANIVTPDFKRTYSLCMKLGSSGKNKALEDSTNKMDLIYNSSFSTEQSKSSSHFE